MTPTFESAVLEKNFDERVEALKPIPVIPDWFNDYGLTSDEFRVYGYVANKASIHGKCCDSVVVMAHVCRLARNVVLAALQNLSEVYHLLIKNKRPGLTDQYFIAPQSQWAEPLRPEDRVLTRQRNFPEETDQSLTRMGCDESEPIPYENTNLVETEELFEQSVEYQEKSTERSLTRMGCDESEPIPYENTNLLEAEELFEQSVESHQEWSDDEDNVCGTTVTTATASIWRRNKDATRYCQIPPIHNQSIGVEIQRQISQEGLTAQAVVERAIAFSKVPKLILVMFCAIAQQLQDVYDALMDVFPQGQSTVSQQDSCDFAFDYS